MGISVCMGACLSVLVGVSECVWCVCFFALAVMCKIGCVFCVLVSVVGLCMCGSVCSCLWVFMGVCP